MISCNLQGGLGNQLFQIFTTISLSIDNDKKISFSNQKKLGNRSTYWSNFLISLSNNLIPDNEINKSNKYIEPNFHYNEINNKVNYLDGYFQSYKYFEKNFEQICNLINLDFNKQQVKDNFLPNVDKQLVSLHFRMGDYKNLPNHHPIMSIEYYEKSIEYIISQQNCKLAFLYFCEKEDNDYINDVIISSLQKKFSNCTFIKANDDIEDWEQMLMMSNCNHNIIANSSFSWWGAYFNTNTDKIVCYPSLWFGQAYSHYNLSDLCPNTWRPVLAGSRL